MVEKVVAALDQGTSSTRVILFSHSGDSVFTHQEEVTQMFPQPGWVEEDPLEIAETAVRCMRAAAEWAAQHGYEVAALGVTNQRETTVAWNKHTGMPLANAVVWLDTRTKELVEMYKNTGISKGLSVAELRELTGLPMTTYFSAFKIRWLMENVPAVQDAVMRDECCFGTIDSWLISYLTKHAVHVTDVTNASRTFLMNIQTCCWDERLSAYFQIPVRTLPKIVSSSEKVGEVAVEESGMVGIPISGVLGDQQGALVGQMCLTPGLAKSTYGTGCFMLKNVGSNVVYSQNGLVSTVGYKLGPNAPIVYALEGSVAIAGVAVQWLRDNLGIIREADDMNTLCASVEDTGNVYFVPAFSGLFAPRWRSDARGCIVGMTQYTTKAHIARAVLEATCFQALEVFRAMDADSSMLSTPPLTELRVDGGMTKNPVLVQLQADLLGIPVVRPAMRETTALGAAIAAGLAVGEWQLSEDGSTVMGIERHLSRFDPTTTPEQREERLKRWCMAVERSYNWV